jgi:transposase
MGEVKKSGGYPSDVTDEEWAFVLPYLLLCREDSPQRRHDLRAVFNAVRYVARTGGQWRYLPHDLPPWFVVYQQVQRWLRAGCFEMLVEDVRSLLRQWGGRKGQSTAVVIDSRTLQSTAKSGARAGYCRGPRSGGCSGRRQQVTGQNVELAYVDQGYTGANAAEAAQQHGLRLEVVKHTEAKRGFGLLPRRWVIERSFAWATRFRRLARDYERLDTTLKGLHRCLSACLRS